jgi:hypothetical protein
MKKILLTIVTTILFSCNTVNKMKLEKIDYNGIPIEYQLYSIILNELYNPHVKGIFLIKRNTAIPNNVLNYLNEYLLKNLGFIPKDELTEINKNNIRLERKFKLHCGYVLLDEKELYDLLNAELGWQKYFRHYPNSQGIIGLSKILFVKDKNEAVIYFDHMVTPRGGSGNIYHLIKTENNWKIKNMEMIWIS